MLPTGEFQRHADPESLFVAVDHETEGAAIYQAIKGVYGDRFPDVEKKSTLTKSHSHESNSD
jgi:hypothetical protein